MNRTRAIVCQHGSRRRYAVPRLMEEIGILHSLYTDSTVYSPLGQLAYLLAYGVRNRAIRRLAKRRPEGVPRDKVHTTDVPLVVAFTRWGAGRRASYSPYAAQHKALSRRMVAWGTQGANWVYSMYDESLPFLRHAKAQSLNVAVDVFISPACYRIMEALTARYPGWGRPALCSPDAHEAHMKEVIRLADLLICPSRFVASGVSRISPEDSGKIRICPYGCTLPRPRSLSPIPGGVFCAGRDALRKGIPVLVDAAKLLVGGGGAASFRIAGVSESRAPESAKDGAVSFLGELTSQEVLEEFRSADVFVLPSFAEGQAGVVVEAMSLGVPVIATRECGVDFQHGVDGILVPSGDPRALADAIRTVVSDRSLRNGLAEHGRVFAQGFTMRAWEERLRRLFMNEEQTNAV